MWQRPRRRSLAEDLTVAEAVVGGVTPKVRQLTAVIVTKLLVPGRRVEMIIVAFVAAAAVARQRQRRYWLQWEVRQSGPMKRV